MRASRILTAAIAALVGVFVTAAPQPASAQALPATCASFTDHPVQPQVTTIKAQYFLELRTCIDDLRGLWSLGGYSWSGPITAGQTWIQVVHLQELRSALNTVYGAAGVTLPTYADAVLTAQSSTVRAVYVNELRASTLSAPLPQVSLAPPAIGPAPGAYNAAVSVTMSAATGATIRYTIDGTAPTSSSPMYAGPLTVSETTTVKARASQAGLTDSSETSASYVIDQAPPTISTRLLPAANAEGWNNTEVTVTFTCSDTETDVVSCPPDVTLANDGAGQVVTGTATDAAGNSVTHNVTVNIDRAPGELAVEPLPAATTSNDVSLSAIVSDSLSGVVSARCNGLAATVTAGQVDCSVALRPGRNAVIVHALDRAGNSSSVGSYVTKDGTATVLTITPGQATIGVGASRQLVAAGEFGPVAGVSWTSDDEAVAQIDPDGRLTAVAAGETTVTAASGSVSAEAVVTVVAGATAMATGTVHWSVAPMPDAPGGAAAMSMIPATRVDEDGAQLFALETTIDGSSQVRAIGDDGTMLWTETAAGTPLFADTAGGLVSGVLVDGEMKSLVRSGGPRPWRYDSAGSLGTPAQAPDGTIFVSEWFLYGGNADRFVVTLDGETGELLARAHLPYSVRRYPSGLYYNQGHQFASNNCLLLEPAGTYFEGGWSVPGVVGADGAYYTFVAVRHETWSQTCNPWPDCHSEAECRNDLPPSRLGTGQYVLTEQHFVFRITRNGGVTSNQLFQIARSGADTLQQVNGQDAAYLDSIVPTEEGTVLTWRRAVADWAGDTWVNARVEQHVAIWHGSGVVDQLLEVQSPGALPWEIPLVGDANTAFVRRPDGALTAVDAAGWTAKWTLANAAPVAPLPDGGLLVDTGEPMLSEIGTTGELTATEIPSELAAARIQVAFGLWVGGTEQGLSAVVGPAVNEAAFSFQIDRGNVYRQGAPRLWYSSEEAAALSALEYIYPNTMITGWEWGGLVCQRGAQYFWAPLVTSENADSVQVFGRTGCPIGTDVVADFHTHIPNGGDPEPSGFRIPIAPSDMNTAIQHPTVTFYLKAPAVSGSTNTHTLRYKAVPVTVSGATVLSAHNNVFKRAGSVWTHYPPPQP